MTVTIDLPEDTLKRLQAEARRRGVTVDLVVAEFAQALPVDAIRAKTLSFNGLGSSNAGRYARETRIIWPTASAETELVRVDTSVLLAAADNADPVYDSCTQASRAPGR
jgi:hypothetical protein